ncbi:MAG: hypothetical protein K2X81_04980, partial [Candidatus Obscuribacterales bacterium]|nr:hypothetical protein [Candidatus Obscuribacterales bacterium]
MLSGRYSYIARRTWAVLLILLIFPATYGLPAAKSEDINPADARLRPPIRLNEPSIPAHPLSISEVVSIASGNYPKVLKARIQVNAARDAVSLQKINEYMPEGLFQYQEIMASRN